MHGFRLLGHLPDGSHIGPAKDRENEEGYLLFFSGVLILIIIALLSSYAFVLKRDSSYKANYAAGERFAKIVAAAHFYAQQQVYDPDPDGTVQRCTLLAEMSLPDGGAMATLNGTTFVAEICGADSAPVNASPAPVNPAASAYVHLRIRSPSERLPSDTIAFLAGAAAHGMDRVGIYGQNAGGLCDGDATGAMMRWGPDDSACLTDNLITTVIGFTDVQAGDIIVPAWETALSQNDMEVIYRYPQPERPDMNAMTVPLRFEDSVGINPGVNPVDCDDAAIHCIRGVNRMIATDLVSPTQPGLTEGFTTIGATGTTDGELLVRAGSATTFNGTTETNDTFRIYDQAGGPTAMTVNSVIDPVTTLPTVIDLSGSTTSVGGLMSKTAGSPGTLAVSSNTDVVTNTVGHQDLVTVVDTTIQLTAGGSAAIEDMAASIPTGMNMTNAARRLSTLGNVGTTGSTQSITVTAPAVPGDPNVFAATVITTNSACFTDSPTDPGCASNGGLAWDVGSIDQRGGTDVNKRLNVQSITINNDCIGKACPNNVNEDPTGGF